jgi:hypothetical protein
MGVSALEVDITKLKDVDIIEMLQYVRFNQKECAVLVKEWRTRAHNQAKFYKELT